MQQCRKPEKHLPWIAAAVSGALTFLGYPGFEQFYLGWICLVPLLWAIRNASARRAFWLGWVAGLTTYLGGFYWIVGMFREFAGLPLPLAVLGLVLIAAANGLVFALWAPATRLITRDAGWSLTWVSPVTWTSLEWLWPEIFPNYLGASQYELTLLTQVADFAGILGVTFLVAYASSTVYSAIERGLSGRPFTWRPVLAFALTVAAAAGYGAIRIRMVDERVSVAEKLKVGLVQTNRGAREKHEEHELFVREHQEMSRELAARHAVDLVVWPESVLDLSLLERKGRLPPDLIGGTGTPTLFGAVLWLGRGDDRRVYGSAFLVDGAGQILGTYDKAVLMPFGEYIPFGDTFPWLYSWSPHSGRFWRGSNEEPLAFLGHLLSVNICYEDIFPAYVRKLMRGGPDRRIPHALFNLTNDSWYGDSVEPAEHLVLASFRAIEHRRALVRATNTGISAIVDPVGRFEHRTGQWTRETLVGSIPMMEGRTVYAALGDWVGWVCTMLSILGFVRALQAARRAQQSKAGASGGPPGPFDRFPRFDS